MGPDSLMPEFRALLREHREARHLTKSALAELAGLSVSSMERMEAEHPTRVRRSNATALLTALHREAPMPAPEQREFLEAAGISSDFIERVHAMLTRERTASHASAHADLVQDVQQATAIAWVQQMVRALGAPRTLDLLTGVAAAAGVRLASIIPAPQQPHAPGGGSVGPLAMVTDDVVDGYRVRTIAPAPAPPARPAASSERKPKARRAT